MPYHVVKDGAKFCVEKQDGSKRLGCHPSRGEANKQMSALYASESRNLHLRVALNAVPTIETWEGREHLVVPIVALREGVIHAVNAKTPEFVSGAALLRSEGRWNGHPLVVGHPMRDGRQVSAHDPALLAAHGFGLIRASKVNGARLGMEALVDPARLVALKQDAMLADIRAGKPVEVSVGAFVSTRAAQGEHGGRKYDGEWVDIEPDHLAFLPGGVGACSLEMGCGSGRVAESYLVTAEGFTVLAALPDKSEVGGAMKVGDKVKVNKPGHDAHGKTGTIASSSKGNTVHKVGDLGTFHQSELKAAAEAPSAMKILDAVRLRLGLKALAMPWDSSNRDTPSEAASEEAAELIAYHTMKSLLDGAEAQLSEASGLVDDLVSDETENPTETPEQEAAEEEVEAARLEAVRMLCYSVMSALQNVVSVCLNEEAEDLPEPSEPRYGEALRTAIGKAISAKNMKTIQAAHDASHDMHSGTVALGAECNGMKLLGAATADKPCGCGGRSAEEGADMKTRTERIAALMAHEHNPLKDQKALEANTDDGLRLLEVHCENAAKLKAASDKLAADKAASDKEVADLKAAAAKTLSEEEYLKAAPESIRTLVADRKAQDAADKAALVEKLVPLKTLTKERLEAEPLERLRTLAAFAKVATPAVDFSGRGVPVPRTAADATESYDPPNPYEKGIKALQEAEKVTH